MPRFVLSHEATGDLREVYDYTAADDPATARRVLEEDRAGEALRVWTVHSYLVIYRPDARPLQVVRVLSGYRDIATLFEWPMPRRAVVNTLEVEPMGSANVDVGHP